MTGARLEPPILTRLFQRLNGDVPSANGIPVTVDEAADLIKTRLTAPGSSSPGPRERRPERRDRVVK